MKNMEELVLCWRWILGECLLGKPEGQAVGLLVVCLKEEKAVGRVPGETMVDCLETILGMAPK